MNKFKVFMKCLILCLGTFFIALTYSLFFSDGSLKVSVDEIEAYNTMDTKFYVDKVMKNMPRQVQPEPQPQEPQPPKDIDDNININVETITVDIDNYDGDAEFLWVSDLHIISDDSASGRYADIYGAEYDGASILRDAVKYANNHSLPMVLGADICDYASETNYSALSDILSGVSTQVTYIQADHDIATDLNNPSNWSSSDISGYPIRGKVSGSHTVFTVNGVNVVCVNMSTNRSGEAAVSISQLSSGPTVVCTHVPFPIGNSEDTIRNSPMALSGLTASRNRDYLWKSGGSTWDLNSNERMNSIYSAIINNDNVSAVFCGHTHLASVSQEEGEGVKQFLLGPAFSGTVYHIILK